MLVVKVNDGETEVDIVDGCHIWFKHDGVESLLVGENLHATDRETLCNMKDQISTLTQQLADHLVALSRKVTH